VRGVAWLDHEWSSAIMDQQSRGWDWIGINLTDGGALMAFQVRV
jgi:predicted secreted hydrolase